HDARQQQLHSFPTRRSSDLADAAALRADYREQYIAFVRARQAAQPRARILLMGAENFYPDVAAVAEAAGVTAVKVPALEMTGCKDRKSTRLNSSHVEISYAV